MAAFGIYRGRLLAGDCRVFSWRLPSFIVWFAFNVADCKQGIAINVARICSLGCVHLCLHKGGQPQSSHPGQPSSVYTLEDFCGIEAPFQWDHEQNVMAVVCRQHVVVLALADKSTLDAWCLAIRCHLGCGTSISYIYSLSCCTQLISTNIL